MFSGCFVFCLFLLAVITSLIVWKDSSVPGNLFRGDLDETVVMVNSKTVSYNTCKDRWRITSNGDDSNDDSDNDNEDDTDNNKDVDKIIVITGKTLL